MNKKVLVLTLFLAISSAVSCKSKNDTSSQQDFSSSSVEVNSSDINTSINTSSNDVVEKKLTTPKLIIDSETGIVTWERIPGATHYNYIINDGEVLTTVNNTLVLNDQENVSVQASNDTSFSDFSNAVTFYDTSDIEIEKVGKVKVYFHNSNISTLEVIQGQSISRPTNPTNLNYTFDDWYKDPFYQEKFDFSVPLEDDTIVYANWLENDLIRDTYYWVKASPKIISNVVSSSTGWKFIPLKINEAQTKFKEYYVTVQVNNASETDPAYFIVMDGFSDDKGRTYYKKGTEDFTIKSNGTYNIYFSAEHQYAEDIHILVTSSTNAGISYMQRYQNNNFIKTPVVEVDNDNNLCSWKVDNNAIKYEVIVDNGEIKTTDTNSYHLSKGSHVTVRSVYSDGTKSNWSVPKANINYIILEPEEDGYVYAYFKDSNKSAIKLNKGDKIDSIVLNDEVYRTFEGWYFEPSLKTKVTFPYTINESIIFYPKWNYNTSKEYYNLVDSLGNKIGGLLWNYDNYDFMEYELKYQLLDDGTYYIKSLDGKEIYSTFSIEKKNTYSVYFSEEKLWDNPENEGEKRNVYIRHDVKDIYFTNSLYWSKVNAYYWTNRNGFIEYSWPGISIDKVDTNDMVQDIYKVSIDLQYDYVIFNDSNGAQTVNISIANISNNAFYAKDTKDGSGHYNVGSWTYQE